MMNKYTTSAQKYLKILIFTTLIMSLFIGFALLFRTSQTLEENISKDPKVHKAAFFEAMQEHDSQAARLAVEQLKNILSDEDPFLTEVVPAYFADLYLQYAKALAFDAAASKTMVSQALALSPEHPEGLAMLAQLSEKTEPPLPEPLLLATPAPEEPQPLALMEAVEAALIPDEDQPLALAEEVKDGPPRIPYIDPPPLAGFTHEPEYELADEHEPVFDPPHTPILAKALEHMKTVSNDPCALSYVTKVHPLTPCIDPVTENRFGPALFVVGQNDAIPQLAFTQQPVTPSDYAFFCAQTGECQAETTQANPSPSLIDLSDVQETVHDYNAYCQMAGTCEKLEVQAAVTEQAVTGSQAKQFASWLSQKTGYRYRQATREDVELIENYFSNCVKAQSCQSALLETVSILLKRPETVLIREVKG